MFLWLIPMCGEVVKIMMPMLLLAFLICTIKNRWNANGSVSFSNLVGVTSALMSMVVSGEMIFMNPVHPEEFHGPAI